MKAFIILALVAVAAADVSHVVNSNPESGAQILSQDSDVQPQQYGYRYETSNGIAAQESGVLTDITKDGGTLKVSGSSSYNSPDGPISLTYTADENGFHPEGKHLPTAPPPEPIPEYIQRALEYIASHPPKPEPNQKTYA